MRYLIGVGNTTMADDGIGLLIIERIARGGLERGFEAVNIADEGMRLLFYLTDNTEKIVIVDAVDMGLAPGEYSLFKPEDVETEKRTGGLTTHEGDILRILGLARELGCPSPPIAILGIQPQSLEPGGDLSPALRERFETYVRAALEEIRRNG